MSAMTSFFTAVSIVSLICFALMTLADMRDRRRASATDTGGVSSGK